MTRFIYYSVLAMCLVSPTVLLAQSRLTTQSPPAAAGVTNQNIVDMLKAGIGEDVIIQKMATSFTANQLDASPQGLKQLKDAGASDRLLMVVQTYANYRQYMGGGPSAFAPPSSNSPHADSWHGLVLDESTPEQTIAKMGTPGEDKEDQRADFFRVMTRYEISPEAQHRGFRELMYKSPVSDVKEVKLYFFKNKLALIHIELEKRIDPNKLGGLYQTVFQPSPDWTDRHSYEYYMVAEQARSYIWAKVKKDDPLKGAHQSKHE